jgi:hypothetical protein
VVLPEPKKPVRMVAGMSAMVKLGGEGDKTPVYVSALTWT